MHGCERSISQCGASTFAGDGAGLASAGMSASEKWCRAIAWLTNYHSVPYSCLPEPGSNGS